MDQPRPDEIGAAFPPPRGDEPAGLRRDIADELADHLYCAVQQELKRTHDKQTAQENVLARFGECS